MAITTFDTHKFVRRLEEAGVPIKQAVVQAEVLTEAFNVNLDSLVTKEFLGSRFAEQKAYMDTRFAAQKAYIDTRFAEQKACMDTRFAEQRACMDTRFAEQNGKIDSHFRIFVWSQAIIMVVVILPYLERLMAV